MPEPIRINMVIGEEHPYLHAYLDRFSPKSRAEVLRHLAAFGLLVMRNMEGNSSSSPAPAAPPAQPSAPTPESRCRKNPVSCISIRLRQ